MEEKKIKGGIYYPPHVKRALKRIYADDKKDRKFNDVLIEIITENPKVKAMIERMKKEEGV